ncbi:MAG: FecR domain-containing protein [Halioglobus sp.]|nr:FecR domain-containing protein [Halioglobus sp.]
MFNTVKSGLPLLLLFAVTMTAWSDGRILSFDGDVRVNGEPITSDTLLKTSDTVSTGDASSVRIILSDNSVLDLDAGSEIQISDYTFDPAEPDSNTSEVDILAGTLRYVSGRIAKDDPDNVSFTAGDSTIGVRGTYISISVSPSESKPESQ